MSIAFPSLRRLSNERRDPASVSQWLQDAGVPHRTGTVPQAPCLRLDLQLPHHALQVLVEANNWAQANCSGLHGCAWELLPAQTVRALLASCVNVPVVPAALAGEGTPAFVELVTPEAGNCLPMVQGAAGPVWVEAVSGEAVNVVKATSGTCLSLELRLDPLSLSPDVVRRLRRDDVLQLGALSAQGSAWLGDHLLHTFIFKDNQVEIDSDLILDTPPASDTGAGLGSLSITLDVVLAHLPMTLARLERLGKGSVLELPPSAAMNVRLRDAGHLLAVGELVQIGDQLGVQLRSVTTRS